MIVAKPKIARKKDNPNKIILDEINVKRFKTFFDHYEQINGLDTNVNQKFFVKYFEERTCLFCGSKKPKVKFKKDAHIIPELLENKFVLSNFECDNCNDIFSTQEDSLAKFLGSLRPFGFMKGKGGYKKFKDPKNKTQIYIENGMVKLDLFAKDLVKMDPKANKFSLKAIQETFIPLDVYKVLVKIGLSLLHPNFVKTHYKQGLNFLLKNTLDLKYNKFALLFYYLIAKRKTERPIAMLFQKKEDVLNTIPMHCLVLLFSNFYFQIFLPGYKENEWVYEGDDKQIKLLEFPLLEPASFLAEFPAQIKIANLSSNEKLKDNETTIELSFKSKLKIL